MKRILLVTICCIFTTLIGCGTFKLPPSQIATPLATTSIFSTATNDDAQKPMPSGQAQVDMYLKTYFAHKLIPTSVYYNEEHHDLIDYYYYFYTYDRNDCIGFHAGSTNGGDLLTTLIQDKEIYHTLSALPAFGKEKDQQTTHFDIYTPAYLTSLHTRANTFIQKKYDQDLYSYYVCHLGPGLDIVAGNRWFASTSPYYYDDIRGVTTVKRFENSPVVLLLQSSTIHSFIGLQTIDQTQTGGDYIYPCQAALQNEQITWTCSAGRHDCPNGVSVGKEMSWTLSLNGVPSKPKEIIKPTCTEVSK